MTAWSSRVASFALGLLILVASALAGEPVVTVTAPKDVAIRAGGSAEGRIVVTVAEGFHLQANPASEKYLIPTKLELSEGFGVKPGKPVYPTGRPYRLPGATSDLSVYEGRFEIRTPLEAGRDAQPGTYTVTGKLHYQSCDARRCLPPTFVAVTLTVGVTTR